MTLTLYDFKTNVQPLAIEINANWVCSKDDAKQFYQFDIATHVLHANCIHMPATNMVFGSCVAGQSIHVFADWLRETQVVSTTVKFFGYCAVLVFYAVGLWLIRYIPQQASIPSWPDLARSHTKRQTRLPDNNITPKTFIAPFTSSRSFKAAMARISLSKMTNSHLSRNGTQLTSSRR